MRKPKSKKSRHYINRISMGMLFYLAMGWCGTKFPGWWRFPVPPHPDPEPWRDFSVLSVIGIIAGGVGGSLFHDAITQNALFAGQEMIASGMFAFAASGIVTGIGSVMMKGKR